MKKIISVIIPIAILLSLIVGIFVVLGDVFINKTLVNVIFTKLIVNILH